jgi:L,D-transpeptidase catalytic domain
MPLRSLVSSLLCSGLIAVTLLITPTTAQAESLIDFLWGGSSEWGGERQTVSFDPKYTPGQIIVSFGDRRLYNIIKKGQATSYPIAVPREQSRWQGATTVSSKRENPSWRPTPDMLKENPKLPSWVPGGHPMNPLGVRAMYLGASLYRIHGTDAPWTIGQAVSKGCIRMTNKDVLDLYPRIPVGTKVTVTWERFSTQSVASSDEAIPSDDDVPQGDGIMQPAFYGSSSRNVIRKMPPLPQSVHDAQTAAVRMEQPKPSSSDTASNDNAKKADKPVAKTTETSAKTDEKPAKIRTAARTTEPKPVIEPEADKAPRAAASQGADRAIEAAKKAAAAAAKAAEAARKAADEAKKAAEEAKKASSTSEPAKAAAKSAAL